MNNLTYKGLDILKLTCALLIIPLHINPFPHDSWWYILSKEIGNLGVPCFFIMSGFFLFSKLNKSQRQEHTGIIWHQEKRLFLILLFWLFPYFIIYDLGWIVNGHENLIMSIGEYLRRILFGGPHFFLWYIVSLMEAIILCHLIIKLPLKWGCIICAILFFIGSLFSNGYRWIFDGSYISEYIDTYNSIFTTTRNGLFFGLPCVFIGALIARFKKKISIQHIVVLATLAIPLFIIEFIGVKLLNKSAAVMSPVIVMLSTLLVLIFMNFEFKSISTKTSNYVRKSSLLIYLIHPLLIVIIPTITFFELDYYWYKFYPLQYLFCL